MVLKTYVSAQNSENKVMPGS